MSKLKVIPRKPVSSLLSLSIDCVTANITIYSDAPQYLPPYLKDKALRKILRSSKSSRNLPTNKILSLLIHPQLKSINLSTINVDNETLNLLHNCNTLTELNLRNCGNQNFSSESLRTLFQQVRNLLVLDVSHCESFTDDVLDNLSFYCTNLCELCAEGCIITDVGVKFLSRSKNLKCLTISNTNITGDGISEVAHNWENLQELRVDSCSKVNEDVLKIIVQNCPKLEILTFYDCAVTDENSLFQEITKTCKNLKQLHWTINW